MEAALLKTLNSAILAQGIKDVRAIKLSEDYQTVCVQHLKEDRIVATGVVPAVVLLPSQ